MSEVKLVNQLEYAKMRGVSRQAVAYAIRDGRISDAMVGRKIDVRKADILWAKNTNPVKGRPRGGASDRAETEDGLDEIRRLAEEVGIDPNNVPTLTQSKTLEAAYKAKLAQLDYEERSDKLVDMEKVKKQAFKLARLTRDAMLAIPDRVSAEIAGFTDPFEIHKRISNEIRMAIAEISKVADEPDRD